MSKGDYKEASAIAQKRRADNIAAFYKTPKFEEAELPNNLTDFALKSNYYTPEELDIIQSEADVLLERIASKKWSSVEVAKAFTKAAALAQELVRHQLSVADHV